MTDVELNRKTFFITACLSPYDSRVRLYQRRPRWKKYEYDGMDYFLIPRTFLVALGMKELPAPNSRCMMTVSLSLDFSSISFKVNGDTIVEPKP